MMRRWLVCLAVGAVVAAWVVRSRPSAPVAAVHPAPSSSAATTNLAVATDSARATPDEAAVREEAPFAPLPADARQTPDEYLLQLFAMVDLANAEERHIDKARWGRAVPIAERLSHGPCDCEQRNWLNHFVEMGNDALQGADEEYYRLAGMMRKMARNDKQLADHVFAD